MADTNNFSDINENFDTIKAMLNSIRAQGILNTSDVDKLLGGIHSKLEKLNTEEDIDVIKSFLTELKQNLDERHNVLVSKFGAIESLFSNLLKNSTEAVKSSELKELFDIVATNLSVFSREVVSQKESITDIVLRLDAMRSDETQKKEIIKSITSVKNDIEKVSNGFDSIVISLNENFKTVLRTIAEIDQSETIKGFSDRLNDILNSSNTILSAIQLMDKKNIQIEDAFEGLATQDDTTNIQRSIVELSAKSKEISDIVDSLNQKSYKIDNLAEKIDAAVNIIAGLKTDISDSDDKVAKLISEKLLNLEESIKEVSSNEDFNSFKISLESFLADISNGSLDLKNSLNSALSNISRLNEDFNALDINNNFKNVSSHITNTGEDVKEKVAQESDKISQLMEVNVTRTLNDISTNTEILNSRLNESNSAITVLCEKNFNTVSEHISELRKSISQLDENNIAANNAIFANVTDRLSIFENSLKESLDRQEERVSTSSGNVVEQILNIKNIAENLDYKIDSSTMDITASKDELHALKDSIDNILALDFINVVRDLKVDLYAVKQDLANAVENSTGELGDKFTNDLFGKYELLIRKLDSTEEEIKIAQNESFDNIKNILSNISSSIIDVISYVSTQKDTDNEAIDAKLTAVTESVKDSTLNYVENVRDIVEVVRIQVENNLKQINEESNGRFNKITNAISESNISIKEDIRQSYDKLIELSGKYDSIKELIDSNNLALSSNINEVISSADNVKNDFEAKLLLFKNSLIDKITEFKNDFTCSNTDTLSELKFNSETLYTRAVQQSIELKNELKTELDGIIDSLRLNISKLNENVADAALKIEGANKEVLGYVKNEFATEVNNSIDNIKNNTEELLSNVNEKVSDVVNGFSTLETAVNNLSSETTSALAGTLSKILENFVALNNLTTTISEKTNTNINKQLEAQQVLIEKNNTSLENIIKELDNESKENFKTAIEELNIEFNVLKRKFTQIDNAIDEDLARQVSIIEGNFESLNLMLVDIMNQATDSLGERIKKELSGASSIMTEALSEELEQYKIQIEDLYAELKNQNAEQSEFIKTKIFDLNEILEKTVSEQNREAVIQLDGIAQNLKNVLTQNLEISASEYASLKNRIQEFYQQIANNNNDLVESIRAQLDDITKFIDLNLQLQSEEVNSNLNEISKEVQNINLSITDIKDNFDAKISSLQTNLTELKDENITQIDNKIGIIIDNLQTILNDFANNTAEITENKLTETKALLETISNTTQNNIISKANDILKEVESLNALHIEQNDKLQQILENDVKEELVNLKDRIQVMFEENTVNYITNLGNTNTQLSDEIKAGIAEFKSLFEQLNENINNSDIQKLDIYQNQISELTKLFNKITEDSTVKFDELLASNTEIHAGELQTIESYANRIIEQIDSVKQNSIVCKDLISNLLTQHFDIITKNIEKETDVIVGDIIEQFSLFKDSQKDEMASLTSVIEGSIAGYIVDAVNDLKSYLDIKTDNTILNDKIDTLRNELEKTTDETTENINKLLEVSVFTDSITDLKATNKVLLETMSEKLNTKIQDFISVNISNKFEEKLNLFDKKFTDTIIEKYEEVKLFSTQYNNAFEKISVSVEELISKFVDSKNEINSTLKDLLGSINKSVDELRLSFAELKAQIMNKSFDEAFHASVHNQISGIEDLIKEQLGNIEEISSLCCSNLPELTEMNTIVKYSIQQAVSEIKNKIETQEVNIPKELNKLKTDIITQLLNVFNQISFVAEQEDILDFIQEKHSELITILSHIVTTSDGIETVKDNVAIVDNKLDSLKEDIDLINEKITSIMSSEGNIDYVYSLQDLESDIANLRLVLNEMKADNKSKEFEELINSTNNIYSLVEVIKTEMPKFEIEEFKKDFANLSEDIVSISTRTNKLLLSSDESYKTLQDNLQDFKLVINDLDERTRNFSKESGMDKINVKLSALNNMMQNGAKTNQVFNQVFEYLAEWVDKAGAQIASITDKVETLDDIGQIKIMLEDLRAESQDNSESAELVEALGNVFDKQAKRIASLEAKLDRMIVDSTINSKTSHIDLTPIEDTLNKFLVAIDDKMYLQQAKINSLEEKLEEVVSLVDNKDTAQLTKKVGGMDKQLAKLNKSIEKIASNVVEK